MFPKTISKLKELSDEKSIIIPIMSYHTYKKINKKNKDYINQIEKIAKKKIICNLEDVEKIGKKNLIDILIIAPCTRKYDIKIST